MSLTERKQELLNVLEQTKTLHGCGATSYYSDGTYNASYNDGYRLIQVDYNTIKNRDISMLRELEIINELELVEKNTERETELLKQLELVREYEKICAMNFNFCYPHYIDYKGESVNVDVTQMANKTRVDKLREILGIKEYTAV